MHALTRPSQFLRRHDERSTAQHAAHRIQAGVGVACLGGPQRAPLHRLRPQARQQRTVVGRQHLGGTGHGRGAGTKRLGHTKNHARFGLGETHQPPLGQHQACFVIAHVVAQQAGGHHHQAVICLFLCPLRASLPSLQRNRRKECLESTWQLDQTVDHNMRGAVHQPLGAHSFLDQGACVLGLALKPPYVRENVIQIKHHQRAVRQAGPRSHFLCLVAVAMPPSGASNAIDMFCVHGVTRGNTEKDTV